MTRGYILALGGFVLAVLLASGQAPVAAPQQDEQLIPATPESLGITPEQFRKLKLPKDAMVRRDAARRSDGQLLFDDPLRSTSSGRASGLATGAVVAMQIARFDTRRWRSDTAIAAGKPFDVDIPAGARFIGLLDPVEGARPCLRRERDTPYTPPKDEAGEIFPTICLHQRDAAGRYTVARFLPHYPGRAVPREVAIAPVALTPIKRGVDDPLFRAAVAARRLRVVRMDAQTIAIDVEIAVEWSNGAAPLDAAVLANRAFQRVDSLTLPLREGAAATFDGVTVTLRKNRGRWSFALDGALGDWGQVSADGTRLLLGDRRFGPIAD